MVDIIPDMDDGISYYVLLPQLATLYGRDDHPRRWIRVVDDGVGGFTTNQYSEGDGRIPCDVIETIEVKTFLLAITYGHTPYIETIFAGYKSGIDLGTYKPYIFNEAMLRSYDHRAKVLFEICKNKKSTLLSRSTSKPETDEAVTELFGVLTLWEALMNSGAIFPKNCIIKGEDTFGTVASGMHLDLVESKMKELRGRARVSNRRDMPYKMARQQRELLFASFGLN